MFGRLADWLDRQPDHRRRLYSLFIGITLLTVPCYATGFVLLFAGTLPAQKPGGPVATATPADTATQAPEPATERPDQNSESPATETPVLRSLPTALPTLPLLQPTASPTLAAVASPSPTLTDGATPTVPSPTPDAATPGPPTPVPPTAQPATEAPPTTAPTLELPTSEPPTSEPPTPEPPTAEPPPQPTSQGDSGTRLLHFRR